MLIPTNILAGFAMPAFQEVLRKMTLIFSLVFFCFLSTVFSQENFFENITINPATCGDRNGSIEMSDPPHYVDYIWDDDETDLNRYNLEPGTYTLTGEDQDGCIETIVLDIPEIADCDFQLITWHVPRPIPNPDDRGNDVPNYPCIVVGFNFLLNGEFVDPAYLDITWTVTTPFYSYTSHQPYVNIYTNQTLVSVSVSLLTETGEELPCCSFTDQIILNECPIKYDPPKVYVLKSTFRDATNVINVPGIVELLVYGDGQCGGTTDIRGYMLDDNNGELIPAENLTQTNGFGLNVNEGYVQLSNDPTWAAVPNGSIITIYESGHPLNSSLATIDDPTDANQDFNYIVSLENTTLFNGKTSSWNYAEQYNPYDGGTANLSWQLIEPNGGADAMQVRYPDGTYCHGFSYGRTSTSVEENYFALYITEEEHPYCRIQMDELSHLYKGHFSVHETQGGFDPGVIETGSLSGIVNHLRNCNTPLAFIRPPNDENEIQRSLTEVPGVIEEKTKVKELIATKESLSESLLNVYPNPFQQFLNIDYQSKVIGTGNIWIHDSQGRLVKTLQVECNGKKQNLSVDFEDHPSGLFFIQFRSPDSKFIFEKALLINLD